MARAIAVLAASATSVAGCSFLYVDKYREPPPGAVMPACTSSNRAPIADVAIAVVAGAGVVYAVATNDTEDDKPDTGRAALAGFGSITSVIFAVSAIVGLTRVSTCREEKGRLLR
jgi:hypothetical protein